MGITLDGNVVMARGDVVIQACAAYRFRNRKVAASDILRELDVYVLPGHRTVHLLLRSLVDIIEDRKGLDKNGTPEEKARVAWLRCIEFDAIAVKVVADASR